MKVDISSPDTYVDDVAQSEKTTCAGRSFYDGQDSSTFHTNGTHLEVEIEPRLNVSGIAAEDVFHLGPFRISDQAFIDTEYARREGITRDSECEIEGTVGFAPSNIASAIVDSASPFLSLTDGGNLDANLFALRLREPYELDIGCVDEELFQGDLVCVPLRDDTVTIHGTNKWRTTADNLFVGSDPALHYVLNGLTVSFWTNSAYMCLPDMLVYDLIDSLGFEEMFTLPPSVNCDQRPYMPDITFNLEGKNFTLTPYDYTLDWNIPRGPRRCVTAILPIGMPEMDHGEIILGSAFLRAFYAVFDLDSRTIGCELCCQILAAVVGTDVLT